MSDSTQATKVKPLVYFIAGEPSGDLIGASIVRELSAQTGNNIRLAGIGGESMTAAGLDSQFPMQELSVMGLAEVLPHVRHILRRMRETADHIRALQPDIIVTIDSPSFCLGVLKRLGDKGKPPRVHVVAPTVWAWRSGRVKKFARLLDHILVILPFEPPWFEKAGLPATFIGHPILERGIEEADGAAFRQTHSIPPDTPVLGVFPGSRRGEVQRHLPVFEKTIRNIAADYPGLHIVLPTLVHLKAALREAVSDWPVPVTVITGETERYAAMAACDTALAVSGTVALELARAAVPTVITYRSNPLTIFVVRRMVKIDYIHIGNIILGREAVPERIQEECDPDILARDLRSLMDDGTVRARQMGDMADALKQLAPEGGMPGEVAARTVLGLINR